MTLTSRDTYSKPCNCSRHAHRSHSSFWNMMQRLLLCFYGFDNWRLRIYDFFNLTLVLSNDSTELPYCLASSRLKLFKLYLIMLDWLLQLLVNLKLQLRHDPPGPHLNLCNLFPYDPLHYLQLSVQCFGASH